MLVGQVHVRQLISEWVVHPIYAFSFPLQTIFAKRPRSFYLLLLKNWRVCYENLRHLSMSFVYLRKEDVHFH